MPSPSAPPKRGRGAGRDVGSTTFYLGVNFRVFVFTLQGFKVMVGKFYNSNLKEKRVILGAPLFYSTVDFGVLNLKIWVFKDRVLILTSQFSSSR
jgi:hypothetical protein